MPISKAQKAAVQRYCKGHYDTITVRLPIGYRDRIAKAAQAAGISGAAFIKAALDEELKKEEEQ